MDRSPMGKDVDEFLQGEKERVSRCEKFTE
jgi:hypothetical protein